MGIIFMIVAIILGCAYLFFAGMLGDMTRRKLASEICSGNFIPVHKFEDGWIIDKKSKTGYKYEDGPGCYVILFFDSPVKDGNYSKFDDVYVGQSVNMCQRIHNHLCGKGNGDVYADIKYGRAAYVKFVPCAKDELNDVEKAHIAALNATASYNSTRGGSRRV